MRAKSRLRFFSPEHAVHDEVERHFRAKLPREWGGLVALACFPGMAIEQVVCQGYQSEQNKKGEWVLKRDIKSGKPVKSFSKVDVTNGKWIRAFRRSWARDPDLTLEILCFARNCLARLQTFRTSTDCIRNFFLKYQHLLEKNGRLAFPQMSDADQWHRGLRTKRQTVKDIPVAHLKDDAIVHFLTLTYPKFKFTGGLVKKIRQRHSRKGNI